MVVESNTTTYSQAVQQGKNQHDKHEEFVKTLIQLDPGDWVSFISDMKASCCGADKHVDPANKVKRVSNDSQKIMKETKAM